MILYCFFLSLSSANSHPSLEPIPPEISLHRGMWVLQGWGLGNMATGIPIAITSKDPQTVAFFQMNAGWSIVNVGLASASLIRNKPVDTKKIKRIFFRQCWIGCGLCHCRYTPVSKRRYRQWTTTNRLWQFHRFTRSIFTFIWCIYGLENAQIRTIMSIFSFNRNLISWTNQIKRTPWLLELPQYFLARLSILLWENHKTQQNPFYILITINCTFSTFTQILP